MTKVIEIVVIGDVGSGKSHVLALIDKALRDGYGPHTQVASRDLSLEVGLGSPSPRPSNDTIFSLKEQGQTISKLRLEAEMAGVEKVGTLQGFATGYGIDLLESAIDQAVRLLRDERESEAGQQGIKTVACQRIESHLNELLALQLKQLSEPVRIECSQVGDLTFTEMTSGRQ